MIPSSTSKFMPQAVLTLSNSHAILIAVNHVGDEITYQYSDEEETNTAEIMYDQEGEPYFSADNHIFYLSDFITI